MDKINIGYDVNLGLPADFNEKTSCQAISYDNIDQLITAFSTQELAGIFAPAGTLPYLKDYQIISQALFGVDKKLKLQTNLVTAYPLSMTDIMQSTLGRVNQCCTTSFWAPLIYLMTHLPKGTVLTFQDTKSFPDMLFKTADKKIGSAMVWDIILQQHPKATSKVHELFNKNDLPCPVIVTHANFPNPIKERLNQFTTNDTHSFFTGFQTPDLNAIETFQRDMQKAKEFFTIIAKNLS